MMVGVIRLRLDLSYRGTDFSGWATQPGLRTVQGALEEALARVLRLPSVRLTVSPTLKRALMPSPSAIGRSSLLG